MFAPPCINNRYLPTSSKKRTFLNIIYMIIFWQFCKTKASSTWWIPSPLTFLQQGFSTSALLGQIILCSGGCAMYCRMPLNILQSCPTRYQQHHPPSSSDNPNHLHTLPVASRRQNHPKWEPLLYSDVSSFGTFWYLPSFSMCPSP